MDSIIKAEVLLAYDEQKVYVRYMMKHRKKKFNRRSVYYLLLSLIAPAISLTRTIGTGIFWYDVCFAIGLWLIILLVQYIVDRGHIEDAIYDSICSPMIYTFQFYDDFYSIDYVKPNKASTIKYSYDEYSNSTERIDAFYFYVTDKAYIIPKRCITQGTPEQLSALLSKKLAPCLSNKLLPLS